GRADGSILVGCNAHVRSNNGASLLEVRDGRVRTLIERSDRLLDIATHGETAWMATDNAILQVAITGATPPIEARGFTCCGPLFLDREGSLWHGTLTGLQQFPGPETGTVGVPGVGIGIESTPTEVVMTGWSGVEHAPLSGKQSENLPFGSYRRPCS